MPEGFLDDLRRCVPKDGDDYSKFVSVVVKPGKEIGMHRHDGNWTALFYVDPADTPIVIGDAPYLPEPQEVVVLEPGRMHAVPKNDSGRLRISIAMLVEE